MNLFISPIDFFAKEYSKATGTQVTASDIAVDYVTTVPNYYPPDKRVKNTMARIVHDKLPVILFYDRVSIDRYLWLANAPSIALPSTAKGRVRELIPNLNKAFGLSLEEIEIEDDAYVINGSLTSVTFRLHQECRYFLPSSFSVTIAGSYEIVGDEVQHVPIDMPTKPFLYQDAEDSYTGARAVHCSAAMTARNDYTPIADILENISAFPAGPLFIDYTGINGLFFSALKSCDGMDWNVGGHASRIQNLFNGSVIYNGSTKSAAGNLVKYRNGPGDEFIPGNELINEEFDNVLIMGLYPNGAWYPYTGFHQQTLAPCIFHYNNSVRKGRIDENVA